MTDNTAAREARTLKRVMAAMNAWTNGEKTSGGQVFVFEGGKLVTSFDRADYAYRDVKERNAKAVIRALALPNEAPAEGIAGWRCYHCGDIFTDDQCARRHFGRDEDSTPACQIKAGAEQGLLGALRDAEYATADAQQDLANECTEAAKAYYAQTTRHNGALRNAEEAGYERGLAEGRMVAASLQAAIGGSTEQVIEQLIRREVGDACYEDIRWFSTREIVERVARAALAAPSDHAADSERFR